MTSKLHTKSCGHIMKVSKSETTFIQGCLRIIEGILSSMPIHLLEELPVPEDILDQLAKILANFVFGLIRKIP